MDVLLFIDQRITNTQTKDPRTDRRRMRMILVSQDGTWKIDSLTLI
jgi:Mce-associated membrane protein